ncbi:translation initiation factor IF-2 [Bilifractor sp. HCP3S3_D3]|uniref:translation initiation factor IF-2 n=1 Tax=Bilifractor sp. HCP3S3_D3 TaxID=3438907 RepID=UPI003F8CEBCB
MNNNENEGKMVNDKIEKAAKAEESKTSREDSAAKGEKEAKPVKKKKRLIAVFHPQNASSKEGKSFHQVMDKDKKKKSREKTGRTDGAAGRVEGSRRGVMQESSRGGRPVGNRASAGTPIVKVPRPHPVIRTEEAPKPAPAETKKKSAVRNTPVTEAAKPEAAAATIGAETASAKPNAAESAKINSSAAEMAEKSSSAGTATEVKVSNGKNGAPQSEATAAEKSEHETASQERPAAGTASVAAGESSERQNQGTRNDADRSGGQSRNYGDRSGGQGRSYGDRNNGGQGRSYGDRNNGGQGRSYGDRNNGGQGRSYGDRNNGGQSRRPFGDRNNRPGFGGNRPGFGGNRPGFGGKDAEEGNRFPGHSRGQHSDHKGGQGAAMDMGLKKPSRDGAGHNKDKDKNKSDLRGNKYTSDRGNGRNNRHLIPKALQRPVHKKEEKKEEKVTEIKIPEKVTIRELAEKMKMQPSVIVKDLFMKGEMYTVNQEVDYEKAEEIAMTYDILCEPEEKVDVIAEMLKEDEEDESKMIPRPPVVCVMGHVDHGKTSLLDAIRHAHVTSKEAGGITQNIGAYVVNINNKKITFLDTPGHEAFTAMRLRGAQSTDIAVLVVAADDGVMPQTIEAINHAKAAGVEIIVAINKIDKPGANVDRVKQELTEYGLIASDWGGQTEMVEVSAKTGVGLDDLLETILLTADIMELKANPDRLARGLVLEAKLDKGKGPVANLLVQKGTLHVGDYIACGACSGKVRAMTDENGKRVKTAGPSTPVEVQGLDGVPDAGETLVAMETDKEAKNFAATFTAEHKNQLLEETKSRMSLDDLFSQIQDGSVKELELVIKADVQGSVEAIRQSLLKLSNDEVVVKIIHAGVGAINESDVTLAAASNAIVIGFNVRPDANAKALAEQEKVDVRLYKVIYQAIDDIEAAMKGMLEPIYEEKVIGHAEVRQLFKASGVGTIAGSYVLDGIVQRGCKVRISRGDKQIFEGDLASLKRFKDDVKEVKAGYECGLVFDGFNEVREGDQVEAYAMVEVPR